MEIKWWHRIQLPNGVTPGICDHSNGDPDYITNRFGMPKDLTAKTVLDIGCWDGLFSFEAEKRGAAKVVATDIYQVDWANNDGFAHAKKALDSKVEFLPLSVHDIQKAGEQFDVVLFYGVLYHVSEPFDVLKKVAAMSKNTILIETACMNMKNETPIWTYAPGHVGDPTNLWYPNFPALKEELLKYGFHTEMIYEMPGRFTARATKI